MKEIRSGKRVLSSDADVKSDVLFHHENHKRHEEQVLYRRFLTKHEMADTFKQQLAQIHFELLNAISKEGK